MTFTMLLAAWGALACVVIGLAIYRKMIAAHEDDILHLRQSEADLVNQQAMIARRLDGIDAWGKRLTVAAAVLGVALASYYLYMQWVASTQLQR